MDVILNAPMTAVKMRICLLKHGTVPGPRGAVHGAHVVSWQRLWTLGHRTLRTQRAHTPLSAALHTALLLRSHVLVATRIGLEPRLVCVLTLQGQD